MAEAGNQLRVSTRGWSIEDKLRYFSTVDQNGCWIWTGLVNQYGYGRIGLGRNKHFSAHKVSWINSFGEIPSGMEVLHKCDVPACVNPDHLSVGTHQENMADMAKKLRAAKKLNPAIVRMIRNSKESQRRTAVRFGISQSTVSEILLGKIWNHVQ